jgi:acyl carrier protein
MQLVGVVMDIEDHLGIAISDTDAQQVNAVGDILHYVLGTL